MAEEKQKPFGEFVREIFDSELVHVKDEIPTNVKDAHSRIMERIRREFDHFSVQLVASNAILDKKLAISDADLEFWEHTH